MIQPRGESTEEPDDRPPLRLMNRNFLLLWQGQFVSMLGSQAYAIAMISWLRSEVQSASVIGTVMMLSSLPGLLMGPIGGTFADRHSRLRIIIVCDVLAGVTVLSLAGLLFWPPQETGVLIFWVAGVSVVLALVRSFFSPAISASIPDLVPEEKLAGANSMLQVSGQISGLVGQAMGGVLFRILGAPFFFLFDGLSYLFSAASESFMTIPQKIPPKSRRLGEMYRQFKGDLTAGVSYVWKRAGMRNLILLFSTVRFFLQPILVLFVFYVSDHLKAPPDWFGFLLAGFSAGSIIGAILAAVLKPTGRSRTAAMVLCSLVFPLSMGALGLVHTPWAALALVFIAALADGVVNVIVASVLQLATPSEMRGRVFGLLRTLSGSLAPIGMGLGGVVADWTGRDIPLIYGACGIAMTVLVVLLVMSRTFYSIMATQAGSQVAQAGSAP